MKTVYDFTVKDRKGNDVSLSAYRGKVLLIVNTATGCGFTPHYEPLEEMYRDLKDQGCDLIIFAPHWGVDKTYVPTQEQMDVGYAAIDAGADIVWGSHPHALQPIEYYGDGVIFYSLGNFSFGGFTVPADFDTALLQQEILRDGDGNVSLGELTIVPCCISSIEGRNNYQPTPYEPNTEEYDRVLQKLGIDLQ